MKFFSALLCLLAIPLTAMSQSDRNSARNRITRPLFQNEAPESSFLRWFNEQIADTVVLDTDGPLIIGFKVDKKGCLNEPCDLIGSDTVLVNRLKRILTASPDWQPALKRRKPVEADYFLIRKNPDDELRLLHEDDANTEMPTFDGGPKENFARWASANLVYPKPAVFIYREGIVKAKFVVGTTGYTESIEILSSPGRDLSSEVIRVIFASPRWTPGSIEGIPVKVHYILPIQFRLVEPTPGKPSR